jgi:hypothetical protein
MVAEGWSEGRLASRLCISNHLNNPQVLIAAGRRMERLAFPAAI